MSKLPSRDDLDLLVRDVRTSIRPEYRASNDEIDAPGICLTIGWNPDSGGWGWQTGDNSFSGNASFYPVWAVVNIYTDTDVTAVVDEILEELEDYDYDDNDD